MGKIKFTSFITENVDKIIPCALVLSMLTVTGYAVVDTNHRKNVLSEISQKSYVSQSGSNHSVNDLFYVKKEGKTYYCIEEKVDEEYEFSHHFIPSVSGRHFYGRMNDVYEYTSVDNGEVVCLSNDGCGAVVEELESVLLEDVLGGEVTTENLDQSYLVMKIGSK